MIKNITFAVTLIFSMLPSLYLMEVAQQDSLDFCINNSDSSNVKNLNLQFRCINLGNLLNPKNKHDTLDYQSFIGALSDFEANKNAYGPEVADFLETMSLEDLLASFIKQQDRKLLEMPEDQKIMVHWIIEDTDNNNAFVGRMCVHTYVGKRPETYAKDFLLAFGFTVASAYRNKKVLSSIAQPILDRIAKFKNFKDAIFCFDTDAENIAMQTVAIKIGAQKIHSWARNINVANRTMTRNSDLFIIPKRTNL